MAGEEVFLSKLLVKSVHQHLLLHFMQLLQIEMPHLVDILGLLDYLSTLMITPR